MTLEKIKEQSSQYDGEHKRKHTDLTPRFKALVRKHGVSYVAAATGLAESSVLVYSRCKVVPVSEYNVTKAEAILNNQ